MSSRFLVRQGSQTVIIHVSSGGPGGNAQEPPSPVAVAQCTLIVNLMVCATWLGLWAGYDMAENCDKDLRLWYALMLGGIVFGLICQVGLIIATKKESKPALKLCNVLIKLDHLFEFGVHLWGVDLAYGKKSDRVGTGGCKVLATWQKVNATAILCFGALVLAAIMTAEWQDVSTKKRMRAQHEAPCWKAEEKYVGAEMTKRMRAQQKLEDMAARQDLEAPTPRSRGTV